MHEIKKINEVRDSEFSILKYIKCACKEYSFQYFLAGGTVLGVIWHKDFIPWDKDIYISMLRKDYKKIGVSQL